MASRTTATEIIIGPTLADVEAAGLNGKRFDIATAFYTRGPLSRISISAKKIRFLCRLNTNDLREWADGLIAPDALHDVASALVRNGSEVDLFFAADAHAKAYVGKDAVLIGSANFTLKGLGGGLEIMNRLGGSSAVTRAHEALDEYAKKFSRMELSDLGDFVARNRARIKKMRKRRPPIPDRLPKIARDLTGRFGDYEDFKRWLETVKKEAANETLARAEGKGQLSGHIYRNFYGLRQFLLANPKEFRRFIGLDEDTYKLSADPATEAIIADFVAHDAVDEARFSLETWKTYLPEECGGRAGKHGGTIGNLNRMLPLVAKYLRGTGVKIA